MERVTHLGFEVRVDLTMDDGSSTWVQLSRGAAAELDLAPGDQVWISRVDTPSSQLNRQDPDPHTGSGYQAHLGKLSGPGCDRLVTVHPHRARVRIALSTRVFPLAQTATPGEK